MNQSCIFFFKQKTAYEMRISDWSSDVCSSDLKLVLYTRAGAEIGVASTKAFTTQLVALFTLCATLAKLRGRLPEDKEAEYIEALRHLPGSVQHALKLEPHIATWAERFAPQHHALLLGRGVHSLGKA